MSADTPLGRLRVGLVHSYYSSAQPSGENAVVDAELSALRRGGFDVQTHTVQTDALQQRAAYSLTAAVTVMTGRGRAPALDSSSIDIVHVHNLFPNYSTRWLRDIKVPVVATMHNFRPLCANGILFRSGEACTECLDAGPSRAVRNRCYRGSRAATLPVALSTRRRDLLERANKVLVYSDFARRMYERAGVQPERLAVISNFVPDELAGPRPTGGGGRGWVYAGRLTAEKGVLRLAEQWPSHVPLTVFGSGSDEAEIARIAERKRITMVGAVPRDELATSLRLADGLVFPSMWAEGFPVVYAEAMAAGAPVLAFQGSSVADFVERDRSGVVITWDEPFEPALERAASVDRSHCRDVFETSYSETAFLTRAQQVYSEVVGAAND